MPAPSQFWRQAVAIGVGIVLIVVAVIVAGNGGESGGGGGPPATTTTTASKARGPAGELSQDELVDTVILAGFKGSDPGSDIVGDVKDHRYGGVLIGRDNWSDSKEGTKLIAAIRDAGSHDGADPPLIVTAQEGGRYRDLMDLPPPETELVVGNAAEPKLTQKWAENTSKALRSVGIDVNLAPVADVAPVTSPLAERTFSDDPELAAELTVAYVRGCEDAKLACAPSHFPGQGAAAADTDVGPASVGLDEATLEERDLVPFLAAFRAGAPATVISHAFYAPDPATPGSLSPAVATNLLRKRAHFDGVAISDDIGAGAITATGDPADAAVRALAAGVDLVQVADPDQVEPVRRAIRAALEDGTLDESRLREAAGRVLKLQRKYGG